MRYDSEGIHIHQSDLKNHCLEKLRLETVATGPRLENDAATVGTALHAVIEHELAGNVYETLYDCQSYAAHTYLRLLEEYKQDGKPYALSSFNTHDRAVELLVKLAAAWFHCAEREALFSSSVAPHVEWNFDLPFCDVGVKKHGKKSEIVPVFLAGTADIIHNNMVWDWKTSGSEYRRWEYQRWGRQPDVYTWAAAKSGLIVPNSNGIYRFDFKVFVRNNDPLEGCQTVTVERSANSWSWLQEIISRLVNFSYNMGLDREWPLDDQHVLCSPKWCMFFDMCKGSHVSGETWT